MELAASSSMSHSKILVYAVMMMLMHSEECTNFGVENFSRHRTIFGCLPIFCQEQKQTGSFASLLYTATHSDKCSMYQFYPKIQLDEHFTK